MSYDDRWNERDYEQQADYIDAEAYLARKLSAMIRAQDRSMQLEKLRAQVPGPAKDK